MVEDITMEKVTQKTWTPSLNTKMGGRGGNEAK